MAGDRGYPPSSVKTYPPIGTGQSALSDAKSLANAMSPKNIKRLIVSLVELTPMVPTPIVFTAVAAPDVAGTMFYPAAPQIKNKEVPVPQTHQANPKDR